MLKIHTSDGRTARIDLSDPEQAREWLPKLERDSFQAEISGVSVVETHAVTARCHACDAKVTGQIGVQYSITRPQAFASVRYEVEHIQEQGKVKGGDRVTLFVDDVRLMLMAHRSQPSSRLTVAKIGKRRYVPPRGGVE